MDPEAANELDPELSGILDERFPRQGETESEGSGEPGSGEPEPPIQDSNEPETPVDEWVWDDGFRLTKEGARTYAELEAYLAANPEVTLALNEFLSGGGKPPTEASPAPDNTKTPAIESKEEFTDPEVQALFERLQATQAELDEVKSGTTSAQDFITRQQEQTAESLANRAYASFKEQFKLEDSELETVKNVAGRLQVLPSLMSPVDPITGAVRQVDPLAAIEEALTIAYWQIPEFRTRAIQQEVDSRNKDRARKARVSSLSGSSGSIPKENPVSENPQTRHEQMVAEVAQLLGRES